MIESSNVSYWPCEKFSQDGGVESTTFYESEAYYADEMERNQDTERARVKAYAKYLINQKICPESRTTYENLDW